MGSQSNNQTTEKLQENTTPSFRSLGVKFCRDVDSEILTRRMFSLPELSADMHLNNGDVSFFSCIHKYGFFVFVCVWLFPSVIWEFAISLLRATCLLYFCFVLLTRYGLLKARKNVQVHSICTYIICSLVKAVVYL